MHFLVRSELEMKQMLEVNIVGVSFKCNTNNNFLKIKGV